MVPMALVEGGGEGRRVKGRRGNLRERIIFIHHMSAVLLLEHSFLKAQRRAESFLCHLFVLLYHFFANSQQISHM